MHITTPKHNNTEHQWDNWPPNFHKTSLANPVNIGQMLENVFKTCFKPRKQLHSRGKPLIPDQQLQCFAKTNRLNWDRNHPGDLERRGFCMEILQFFLQTTKKENKNNHLRIARSYPVHQKRYTKRLAIIHFWRLYWRNYNST